MDFKGVFFDFDYTLGDGTEAILAGFRYAFAQMGLPEPEDEAVRRTIGMVLEDEYTALSGDTDPGRRARFRQLYAEKAGPLQPKLTKLFPGARALLEALHRAGLPAGVTKRAHAVLRQLEASAPGRRQTLQLDFETVEAYNNPVVPSEVVEKLHNVDIETLTPLEALNFLYELKNTLDK